MHRVLQNCCVLYIGGGRRRDAARHKNSSKIVFSALAFLFFAATQRRFAALGIIKTKVLLLPSFALFCFWRSEDRMRLGIAKLENFVFVCLCSRLSLLCRNAAKICCTRHNQNKSFASALVCIILLPAQRR